MVVVDGRGVRLGDYLSFCIPGGSPARGNDARGHPDRASSPRPDKAETVRVIADKAYDSDPLRKRLRQRGIELICPHKKNHVRPATQDGRALRWYKALDDWRRWP
jgi:hypothetical protein